MQSPKGQSISLDASTFLLFLQCAFTLQCQIFSNKQTKKEHKGGLWTLIIDLEVKSLKLRALSLTHIHTNTLTLFNTTMAFLRSVL